MNDDGVRNTTLGRVLGQFGPITLKIFVFLIDNSTNTLPKYKKKYFRKWVSPGNLASVMYEFVSFLQLDYNGPRETYNKDHRMSFPIFQAWKLIRVLDEAIDLIDKRGNEIFYIDKDNGDELNMFHVSEDLANEFIKSAFGFTGNHNIQIAPQVVVDYQDNKYEGVRIYFDRTERYVDLSYDEVSSLKYILSKTDFVNLSQEIVNSTLLWSSTKATRELDMVTEYSTETRERVDLLQKKETDQLLQKQLPTNLNRNIEGPFKWK